MSRLQPIADMPYQEFFKNLIGRWEGNCRTWFVAGQPADESTIAGEFSGVLNGPFVRHVYHSSIRGKPRCGEELIAFNTLSKRFECAWIDDFHMSSAIMFSIGESTGSGFNVTGEYEVGGGQPNWSWRTEYQRVDDNQLKIVAFNIDPGGTESKAVETSYRRVGGSIP